MSPADRKPRAVIVHDIHHARAAAQAAAALGVPVVLRSAPGAAAWAGAGWFAALIEETRRAVPDANIIGALECGDAAGNAMAALACGVELIRFDRRGRARERIKALAAAHGAALDEDRQPALDLGAENDIEAALKSWLGGGAANRLKSAGD